MMSLKSFYNGLKKSFTFSKDFLRNINHCEICHEPSYSTICQLCEMKRRYEEWEKKNKRV